MVGQSIPAQQQNWGTGAGIRVPAIDAESYNIVSERQREKDGKRETECGRETCEGMETKNGLLHMVGWVG